MHPPESPNSSHRVHRVPAWGMSATNGAEAPIVGANTEAKRIVGVEGVTR